MAWVRRDGPYHYLVTSERRGSKVRQRTVAYLGYYRTVAAALEGLPEDIARHRQWAFVCRMAADSLLENRGGYEPDRPRRGEGGNDRGGYWYWRDKQAVAEWWQGKAERRLAALQGYVGEGCSG